MNRTLSGFYSDSFGQNAKITVTPQVTPDDGIEICKITVDYPEKVFPGRVKIWWFCEFDDAFSCWTPRSYFRHELMPSWIPLDHHSFTASGAPVFALMSKGGNNRCTFALSDAATPMRLTCGMEERQGKICCTVELFTSRVDLTDHYETLLRIDYRDIPYYDSLYDVRTFWSKQGYSPAFTPVDAKRAMFSSWYSFQKDIDEERVLEQCRMAKEYGLDTLILDDGWQCDEVQNGYTYCGDWKPTPKKFPDMRRFVEHLHEIGMKCILWYSVPLMGRNAESYKRFTGKYVNHWGSDVGVLDPRFADVREYLIETYTNAVSDWNLDGLKLDFIDTFSLSENSPTNYEDMDVVSLQDGVDKLLSGIIDTLKQINPEIMLEFRQSYVGPIMQKYGNIFRVGDCAGASLNNRVNSIDLRLLTGNSEAMNTSAVHSDMLMWDYEATPEGAADQLSACLFCTPQISVFFEKLPENHRKMLHTYLDFMESHRDVLLESKLIPENPAACYTRVSAKKNGRFVCALYDTPMVNLPADCQEIVIVNATGNQKIYLETEDQIKRTLTVKNCMGETVGKEQITFSGVIPVIVPHNGFLYLE